jgi:hypothetical protein
MASRQEQARLFNEAIAQGLTEDQALAVAGITNPDEFTYGFANGQLEPVALGVNRSALPQNNPPNPQVPAVPAPQSRVRTATPAAQNNPPNPQVPAAAAPAPLPVAAPPENPERDPVTGALRIDITGVAPPVVNDNVTTLPPTDQPTPRVPLPVPPAEGISPYGEEDDPFEPPPTVSPQPVAPGPGNTGSGITGPVPGITGFGEEDDLFDPDAIAAPAPVFNDPQVDPNGPAFDDDGNLNPGFTLDGDGNVIFVGDDFVDPSLTASAEGSRAAARQAATLANARQQAAIQSQRKQNNDTDWRVRLSLAPQSNYLYNAPDSAGQPGSGILAPLRRTNGVIFPYTPRITTVYEATYNEYNLTHSNYRGFFYQGSKVGDIQIEATFTAQDTAEAEYLLAVIHFFKSVTKMFYGQDPQRGTPPPLVYLSGYGDFQYNQHPCVVAQFNYNLPQDIDYIRARSKNTIPPGLLQRRQRQAVPTNIFESVWARLTAAGLTKGAQPFPPPVPVLGTADSTYVPTKLDVGLILKPMQSREQVSRQFSLKQYANGDLLKGGFW